MCISLENARVSPAAACAECTVLYEIIKSDTYIQINKKLAPSFVNSIRFWPRLL